MKWDHPIWLFMAAQLVTAGGTYAAIRADLREAIIESHIAIKRADEAHGRIDKLMEKQK